LSPSQPRVHFHELDPKAVALTMVGVLTAIFMGALDSTIVATAMPAIVRSLNGFTSYAGVVSAYLIASTVALPIGGKLSDVYGRKRLLIIGMLWFSAASLLCGVAGSMTQLIVFRAVKGLGAGLMQAAATTTIADLYPPARRGRAIGLLSTVSVLSSVIGPVLGGYLADGPGWRYVFLINLPVGLIGSAVVWRYFPRIHRTWIEDFRIDWWGALTLTLGVVPLLLALHDIGETGGWDGSSAGLLALGAVFVGAFLFVESKAAHPIVPLAMFKDSIIAIGLLNTALSMAAIYSVTLFVPLFMQSVLHTSAQLSGEILLPLTLTFGVTATATGFLVGKIHRYKYLALGGTAVAILGGLLLAQSTAESTRLSLLLYSMLTGFGLAVCMPIYNIAVQNAAPVSSLGAVTSMVYFMRLMAGSVGVAVFGSILAAQTPTLGMAPALSHIFYVATGLITLILLSTFFFREIPLRRSNKAEAKV
jgi:EmrB/QacA subfamily drug resistance transporter